ncbi:autotransporter-associated beta strand repeat protein [Chthoniobacter flavus Ellin428]|uniref:Autotransporter-associated beta strand repeat protein n=1 Tax=Chthoniobacter flavus Ellin428 TaxID=497964 RepID=B4D997_9BACT|nr:autotransporter-associated beta strand repeat-containing protein [Chthoniobacter flavus]EDY17000.1 autotransporter-associated beta strand repeat protein [Chthoniobacter flavus Ellin428]
MKHRPSISSRALRRFILANTIAGLVVTSLATTNLFIGSGSWNTPGNWSQNHVPGSSDALFFNSPAQLDNQLNGSFTAQTWSFDTGSSSFNVNANTSSATPQTLTLTGGTNANGGADLISLSAKTTGTITLGGTAGVGTLTIAFGATNGTISVANSAAKLVVGANAHLTGINGITKNGAGTLQILSTNSYTGGTTINFGTIAFANGSLGSGTITLNGGGLQWLPGNTQDISGQLGPVGFGGGMLDTNGNNVTFTGALTGTGTVNKVGTGTLTLTNASSTAPITLTAGTLALSSPGALGSGTFTLNGGTLSFGALSSASAGALSGSGSLTLMNNGNQPVNFTVGSNGASTFFSGSISGQGALFQSGAGTLTLSGDTSNLTGAIGVNQGTVILAASNVTLPGTMQLSGGNLGFGNNTATASIGSFGGAAPSIFSTQNGLGAPVAVTVGGSNNTFGFSGTITGNGSITKVGSGTMSLSGDSSTFTGGLALNAGALQISSSNALGTGTFTYNGGTLSFLTQNSFSAGALAGSGNISLQNNSSQPVTFTVGANGASTTYSGMLSGTGTLVKVGTGTLALTNPVSAANIQLQAGTLDVSASATALGLGIFTINGGALAFGTQTSSSVGALAGSGNLVLTNANNQGVTFNVGPLTASTTYSGAITGLGTLVVNSSGTLTLSGSGSTAGITLQSGSINLSLNGAALGTGTFTINGPSSAMHYGSQPNINAGALAGNGTLNLQNDSFQPVIFSVGSNGASTTFSGTLAGNGTLVMNGPGTMTLSGNNAGFTGTVSVNQGTVLFSSVSPNVSLPGNLNLAGGNAGFVGNLVNTASFGSINATSASSSLSTQNDLGQPLAVTVGTNGSSMTFQGSLTGTGTVIKQGPGTLTLANPNSTANITLASGTINTSQNGLGTGTFTFNGGTLNFGSSVSAGGLAGTADLALHGAVFTVGSNGATTSYAGALSNGLLVMNGPGTLQLTGTASSASITLLAGTIDLSLSDLGLGQGVFTINGGNLSFGLQTRSSTGALAGSGDLVLTNTSNRGVTFNVGNDGVSTTYTGALTGLGTLVKTGPGTLTLTNPNSTANITLSQGGLNISANGNALGSGTFTYNGGALNFGSSVSAGGLAGTADLALHGAVFTVGSNGATTSYAGALSGGTLIMNGPGTLGLAGTGSSAGIGLLAGTIDLSGSSTGLGTGIFTINGGNLTFGNQTSASAGSLAGSGGLVLTNASNQGVAFTVGANNLSTTYTGAVSGLGTLVKTGSGLLTLTNSNSTAGITVSQGGIDISQNGNALGTGTLTVNNGGFLNVGNLTNISAGAFAGFGTFTLQNNFGSPLIFTVGSNGASTSYSGQLFGPGTLVKVGTGTMALTASNSTANLTLANGAFDISFNGDALGLGVFTINGGALNFGTLTSATAGGLAGSGGLVLTNTSNQGVTFTVGSNNVPTTYAGAVTGLGTLVKTGTGSLALTNSNSTAAITLSQGTLDLSQYGSALGSGTFTDNGGTLNFGSLTSASAGGLAGTGTLSLSNNSFQPVALTVGSNGVSTTFPGQISGPGSLVKVGAGTLTLTAANTYGGGTIINGGSIVSTNVGTSFSVFGGGPVSVGVNGMLTGVGFIPGNTAVNGTLAPGNPIGTLNFGNTLSLANTGQLQITLGGETPGTNYSQVFVQNQFTLSGNLNLSFANGFLPNVGDKFFILDTVGGSAISGTFANVTPLGGNVGQITFDGVTFQVNYADSNTDGGSNDVSLTYMGSAGSGFFTWSGAGANTNWSTNANWLNGTAPSTSTFATQLIFSGSGTGNFLTPNNDTAGFEAGSISIQPGTGNFVFSGQSIFLGSGGLTSTRTGTQTFNNAIELFANQTWNIGNGSTVLINGNISGFSSPTLTKTGSGTLILAGATSLINGLTISAGTLQLGNGGTTGTLPNFMPIVDNGNLTFNFSRTVVETTDFGPISGAGTVTQAGPASVFLNSNTYTGGTIITGGLINFGGTGLGTGPVTLNGGGLQWSTLIDISSQLAPIGPLGGTFDTNGNSFSFNNPISGTGTLTKTGDGTLTLNPDSLGFSGGFTVLQGSLNYGFASNALGTGTITLAGGTIGFTNLTNANAGALAGTGNIVLTNAFNQPVNLFVGGNGASTTYSGTLSGLGTLTMNGTGTFTLAGDSTGSPSAVLLQQGTVALGTTNAAAGYLLVLNGGSLSFGTLTSASVGGLQGNGSVTLANVTNQAVALSVGANNSSSNFTGALTGPGALIKEGTGTLTLTNPTSTAAITLNAGTIDINNSPNALGGSTFTINGGTLNFDTQNTVFAGALAGSGPLVLTNSNNQPVQFIVGSNGASTTYSGTLSGFGGLIMNGTGTLTLAGDSTGSMSAISLQQGTVALATPNAAAGYTLALNGGTLSFGSLTTTTAGALQSNNGTLTLTNTYNQAVTFTVGGNNSSTTFGGLLNGLGTLVKTGTGTLTLGNPNSTAAIALNAGTIDINNSSNGLGSGTFTINGGTLKFDGQTVVFAGALAGSGNLALTNSLNQPVQFVVGSNNASTTYSGTLTGLGGVTMNGPGTLTLAGDSTGSISNVNLQQGTVALGTPNAAAGYTLNFSGGTLSFGILTSATVGGLQGGDGVTPLVLTNTNNRGITLAVGANGVQTTFSNPLTGLGTLVKIGNGTLTLSNSTSTAAITLAAGRLRLGVNNALGSGTFTLNGGTLSTNGMTNLGTGTFTINGGSIDFGSQANAVVGSLAGSGDLVLTNGSNAPVLFIVNGSSSTTYSGKITGLGQVAMQSSAGTLTLAGDSTGANGSVTLQQGTVALGTPQAAAGYTLTLNGGALSFGALTNVTVGGLLGNAPLTLTNSNNQPVTLTVGANSPVGIYNGALLGSGSLVMNGGGTLTLGNLGTTVPITLNAGTINLGANNVLGSGVFTMNGGTLSLNNFTPGGSMFTINGGTVNFGSQTNAQISSLAGTGGLVLTNTNNQPVTLNVNTIAGNPTSYGGALTGLGTLVVNGSGVLSLTGSNSTAPITLNGSTIDLSANGNGLGTGLFTILGGGLNFGALTAASAGGLTGSGLLTLTNTSNQGVAFTVGANNGSTSFTGTLTGLGSLIKMGTGTLTLTHLNSYNGGTNINNGAVAITNVGASSVLGTGPVHVGLAGTLTGNGQVVGAASIDGTVAPGNPSGNTIGQIIFGSLTFTSVAHLQLELGAGSPGTGYDQVVSNGQITLAGNLDVSLMDGFTPFLGEKFFILDDTPIGLTITGAFANVTPTGGATGLFTIPGVANFAVNYADTSGMDGNSTLNDVSLIYLGIPEPSSVVALLGGALTLLGWRRRRTRRG